MDIQEKDIEVIKNFRVECENCAVFYEDLAEIYGENVHAFLDELKNDGWTYSESMDSVLCPGCAISTIND